MKCAYDAFGCATLFGGTQRELGRSALSRRLLCRAHRAMEWGAEFSSGGHARTDPQDDVRLVLALDSGVLNLQRIELPMFRGDVEQESTAHDRLKFHVQQWLRDQGFDAKLEQEYQAGRADVLVESARIAVECGGAPSYKPLRTLLTDARWTFYLMPFGSGAQHGWKFTRGATPPPPSFAKYNESSREEQ